MKYESKFEEAAKLAREELYYDINSLNKLDVEALDNPGIYYYASNFVINFMKKYSDMDTTTKIIKYLLPPECFNYDNFIYEFLLSNNGLVERVYNIPSSHITKTKPDLFRWYSFVVNVLIEVYYVYTIDNTQEKIFQCEGLIELLNSQLDTLKTEQKQKF